MTLATTLQRALRDTRKGSILPSINGLTKLTIRLLKRSIYYAYQWLDARLSKRSVLPSATTMKSAVVIEVPSAPVLTAIEQEAIAVAEQASLALAPTGWQAIEADQEIAQPVVADEEPTLDLQPSPPTEEMSKIDRATLVQALLDEAWSMGNTTYPKLIDYVKRHTGKGCSKRVIANWKRERGLLEQVEQAA